MRSKDRTCFKKRKRISVGFILGVCLLALSGVDSHASKENEKKKTSSVETSVKMPKALLEIEENYSKAGTLQAQFKQVNFSSITGREEKTQGTVYAKKPKYIRWETTAPESSLLIGDGESFFFYTPPFDEDERGQLIIQKASQVKSSLADALLAGAFSKLKGAKVEEKSAVLFILIPKKGTSGTVAKAQIEINPDKKQIKKVTLEHRGGNRSEIVLSDIRLGAELKKDLFEFKAPSNTDIIRQ